MGAKDDSETNGVTQKGVYKGEMDKGCTEGWQEKRMKKYREWRSIGVDVKHQGDIGCEFA